MLSGATRQPSHQRAFGTLSHRLCTLRMVRWPLSLYLLNLHLRACCAPGCVDSLHACSPFPPTASSNSSVLPFWLPRFLFFRLCFLDPVSRLLCRRTIIAETTAKWEREQRRPAQPHNGFSLFPSASPLEAKWGICGVATPSAHRHPSRPTEANACMKRCCCRRR